jgi:hypothetical protein
VLAGVLVDLEAQAIFEVARRLSEAVHTGDHWWIGNAQSMLDAGLVRQEVRDRGYVLSKALASALKEAAQ